MEEIMMVGMYAIFFCVIFIAETKHSKEGMLLQRLKSATVVAVKWTMIGMVAPLLFLGSLVALLFFSVWLLTSDAGYWVVLIGLMVFVMSRVMAPLYKL